jgi:hypothetical protein
MERTGGKRRQPPARPSEVTGSIPVRSTEKPAGNGGFLGTGILQIVQDARLWKQFWKRGTPDRHKRVQASV